MLNGKKVITPPKNHYFQYNQQFDFDNFNKERDNSKEIKDENIGNEVKIVNNNGN